MRLQTRRKISKALKAYWRRIKREQPEKVERWRKKISRSVKKTIKTHTTAAERRWGKQVVKEQKKERRHVKIPIELSPSERMVRYLERIREHAPAETDIDAAVHADGSADVELRFAVPRGMDGKQLVLDLAPYVILPKGYWVAFGWIFHKGVMTDEEIADYERFHRMLQVHTHYRRAILTKIQSALNGAIRIYEALEEDKRRKPVQFYIRLHWSPDGRKPE